jgi:hypothetical protein
MKYKTFISASMILMVLVIPYYAIAGASSYSELNSKSLQADNIMSAALKLYTEKVAPILINDKNDMVTEDITDEAITNAEITGPITVFTATKKAGKGADALSASFTNKSWAFLAWVNGKPNSCFVIEKNSGSFDVNSTIGSAYANAVYQASQQLDKDAKSLLMLSFGAADYLLDDSDRIAFVNTCQDGKEHALKTYEELAAASDWANEYNAAHPDEMGGAPTVTYLYDPDAVTSAHAAASASVWPMAAGLACVGTALILGAWFLIRFVRRGPKPLRNKV